MLMKQGQRGILIVTTAVYAVFLGFFFLKYVPLVGPFLTLLLPLVAAVLGLTAVDPRRGLFLFFAIFPLTGSLPYYFRLYENIPQAPTALVLFLFFIAGFLLHLATRLPPPESSLSPATGNAALTPLLKRLLALAAALVCLSALLTAFRFTNFFPFISDRIFEIAVNVKGVTAGGALMSVSFTMFSYLGGLAIFLLTLRWLRPGEDELKALTAFGSGLVLAALVGYIQHFYNPALGNTPFWVRLRQINGTFKDPNAFGSVLSLALPVFLAAALGTRGRFRTLSLGLCALGLGIFPFIGIRSAALALAVSLAVFIALALPSFFREEWKSRRGALKRQAGTVAVILAAVVLLILVLPQSRLLQRLSSSATSVKKSEDIAGLAKALSPARVSLWSQAWAMMHDFPLTGVGVGAFIIELPNYYALSDRRVGSSTENDKVFRPSDSAENLFLQVGSEMGILGLSVFLWLVWGLSRTIWRRRPSREARGGNPELIRCRALLFAGLVAGLAGLLVNTLFHSYVGSFEVIFASSLIMGLTLLLTLPACPVEAQGITPTPRSKSETGQTAARRLWRLGAGILILFFGLVHFIISFGPLSPGARTAEFNIQEAFGFYPPEKDAAGVAFRWTKKTAGLTVRVEKPTVDLPLRVAHPDIDVSPVHIRVSVFYAGFKRRATVGDLTFAQPDWQVASFSLAPYVGQPVLLILDVSRTWSPKGAGLSSDRRELGAAVGTVTFR